MQIENGVYHIITRGNNQQDIFLDSDDRKRYLDTLLKYKPLFGYRVIVYCLMTNHLHLILKTLWPNLSHIMQRIQVSYTLYFNRRHHRVGHLFQGRYKSLLIEENAYLLELSRYIHLNPVRAGMEEFPENYPWSSLKSYVTGNLGRLIDPDSLLACWGSKRLDSNFQRGYKKFVYDGIGKEPNLPIQERLYLGSKDFASQMKEMLSKQGNRKIVSKKEALSLDKVLREVRKYFGKDGEMLERRRSRSTIRQIAMYLARKHTIATLEEIGTMLGGVKFPAISHGIRQMEAKLQTDEKLRRVVNEITNNFIIL